MRHEKYSMYLVNMNMRLIKFVIIPALMLCITMYPAKAFAAGTDVSAGDSIVQEDTLESDLSGTYDSDIQVADIIDYTETLVQLVVRLDIVNALLQYLTGFVLFFVIVILCYFGYKFFKLFF